MGRVNNFILIIIVSIFPSLHAEYIPPQDWLSKKICDLRDSRHHDQLYCLELLELKTSRLDGSSRQGAILLIPGLFQNAYIFDPLPDMQVSFARFLDATFPVRIFVMHVRGIGLSDYPPNSSLDDLAIDDIPQVLERMKKFVSGPLYALGHSQGAITLQASLAGLTRSYKRPQKEFFDAELAQARQKLLAGVGLLTGNVAMTAADRSNIMRLLAPFAKLTTMPPLRFLDRVPASLLTQSFSSFFDRLPYADGKKNALAYSSLWSFLYNPMNVMDSVKHALFKKTLDSSTLPIIKQFAAGIEHRCIRTRHSAESYCDYLKNITLPVLQVTFSDDPLAEPLKTYEDSFKRLGSTQKTMVICEGQGHEDFLLNHDLHASFYGELADFLKAELSP